MSPTAFSPHPNSPLPSPTQPFPPPTYPPSPATPPPFPGPPPSLPSYKGTPRAGSKLKSCSQTPPLSSGRVIEMSFLTDIFGSSINPDSGPFSPLADPAPLTDPVRSRAALTF
ncbi:hypothetical protein DEO72_LG10g2426 [Vigna unguiculata]|uniref:Uncharacterized protein n=1 Tax=Vigna unguiculata TaxID=3917 RepID=A0A4D6NBI4_VIGUN|nr:hypothetical protein DEO72_LG10g2426 [Vigna unguiculata]